MYKDRIEISSPGGLPAGISENEYLIRKLELIRIEISNTQGFERSYRAMNLRIAVDVITNHNVYIDMMKKKI